MQEGSCVNWLKQGANFFRQNRSGPLERGLKKDAEGVAGGFELGSQGMIGEADGEEIGECRMGDCMPIELMSPVLEVGKIDVGGDVATARGLVKIGASEELVVRVTANRACRAAVVERWHRVAVVDGEEFAFFPEWRPVSHPEMVGFMDLHAASCWERVIECG